MKHCTALLIILLSILSACKKKVEDIDMYNKDFSVIQTALQGNWKLQYLNGGLCSCTKYYQDFYWKFNSNRITHIYAGNLLADTSISWIKIKGTFTHGDSTYSLNYTDKAGGPWVFIVDGIYNDTLRVHEYGTEPYFYYFTRAN